jgi:hypothetical protein
MIKHTFSDEDNRPDFVEPGIYSATIVVAEEKFSKSSGNEMIELQWKLDISSPIIWDHLIFGEKTLWKIDTFLKAIGKQPKKGEEVEINAADLIGCRAYLRLRIEEYKGRDQNKVDRYETELGDRPALTPVAVEPKVETTTDRKNLPF